MKNYRLERELLVARPIEEVFDFFGDPMNLEAITPPWLHFKLLGSPDLPLRPASTIDYRLRVRGLPIRWTSLISRWEPPYLFVDQQIRGPYRSWVHLHTFEDRGADTLVRDEVEYSVFGGDFVNRLLVRPDLERVFDYRTASLRQLLNDSARQVVPDGTGRAPALGVL
jgi:ligand-binding SRPBCC domain-containing protein